MSEILFILDQIAFARRYSVNLIDSFPADQWFRMPAGGVTHLAWQVGHLTMAQYSLVFVRLRGKQPGDGELIPDEILNRYRIKTTPDADPANNPPIEMIRGAFERVHARVMQELPRVDPARLHEPIDPPHSIAKTKLEALFWCAAHELIHAGQIGLLRRQLGHTPRW